MGFKSPTQPGKGMHYLDGKGVRHEAESEGSRRQNITAVNKKQIRGNDTAMRRQLSSKSHTYPESVAVDVARMNGEGCAHYRGDLASG